MRDKSREGIYINFQTSDNLFESYVSDENEFRKWCSENLRILGHKLFVVMPGDDCASFFVTSSVTDIEEYFEYVLMLDEIFIQAFEYGDYADAIGYLTDLLEIKEPSQNTDIKISFN